MTRKGSSQCTACHDRHRKKVCRGECTLDLGCKGHHLSQETGITTRLSLPRQVSFSGSFNKWNLEERRLAEVRTPSVVSPGGLGAQLAPWKGAQWGGPGPVSNMSGADRCLEKRKDAVSSSQSGLEAQQQAGTSLPRLDTPVRLIMRACHLPSLAYAWSRAHSIFLNPREVGTVSNPSTGGHSESIRKLTRGQTKIQAPVWCLCLVLWPVSCQGAG